MYEVCLRMEGGSPFPRKVLDALSISWVRELTKPYWRSDVSDTSSHGWTVPTAGLHGVTHHLRLTPRPLLYWWSGHMTLDIVG